MSFHPYQFPHYSFFGVSGDTLLLTRSGPVAIGTLLGQTVAIWNGTYWEQAEVGSAGLNKPLYQITLADGRTLTCSAGYNLYVQNSNPRTYTGTKAELAPLPSSIWRTETETDPDGSAGAPSVTARAATGTSGDLFYVASSTGLTIYNGILASCGYAPEGDVADSNGPPPVTTTAEPVAPDRSFTVTSTPQ